jgi:hypothetical protein
MPRDSHDDWRSLNWGRDYDVVASYDWSDPFADVAAALAANGCPSAKLVISRRLCDALLGHPLLLQRLSHLSPAPPVDSALLARLFDVADVIVTD